MSRLQGVVDGLQALRVQLPDERVQLQAVLQGVDARLQQGELGSTGVVFCI